MTTETKRPMSYEEFFERYEIDERTDKVIRYFLAQREGYGHGEHRKANPQTWIRLVKSFFYAGDDNLECTFDLEEDYMYQLIDKYFETRFRPGCDYSIFHFNSKGVKVRRMYEEVY